MISVEAAESIILGNLFKPKITSVEISRTAGRVLAEIIQADRDLPPFDRVAMDGIAINIKAFNEGQRAFVLEGVQAAGMPKKKLDQPHNAMEVMTGAAMPTGTHAVVQYESLSIKDGVAHILDEVVEVNQNIHQQGADEKRGSHILEPGIKISPAEVALFAATGKSNVNVYELPKTAIISTGDELVGVDEQPQPWQIRRSNSFALQAAFHQMSHPSDQFHISDNEEILIHELKKIFDEYELIILSGGVSKGKFDFIPKTLEQLGVRKLFHQISQKPGKPIWFGRSNSHTVFALPGNPVSTYMCFYRYLKPWLEKSMWAVAKKEFAILASDFQFVPALTYFLQVKTENENGKLMAYPNAGGGSGDFANLKGVDGFLELPLNKSEFKAGEVFPYYSFRL